ncbi:YicC family protein [Emcibacteraceae bacterium]|nr:YicC family protein [Emcibacteraceae bacterium]
MTLSSMTGFGRSNNSFENYSWVWELKSVNGKGLDLRTRIPQGFDTLDKHVKSVAKKVLFRGTLNILLQIKKDGVETVLNVNEDVLNKLIIIAKDAAIKHNLPMPSIDNLLTIRDVLEVNNDDTPDYTEKGRNKAVKLSFDEALKSLISSREEEGAATYCMLSLILDDINRLLSEAEVIGLKQPELLKEKYEKKLGSLFDNKQDIDQDRLAQEIVLLALKSDIKEETDRLNAHIVSARKLLLTNGPVGRKLEFLTQEFNREINTLCSKSSDIRLTNIGLSLKASIDQFREQVLNVE